MSILRKINQQGRNDPVMWEVGRSQRLEKGIVSRDNIILGPAIPPKIELHSVTWKPSNKKWRTRYIIDTSIK